MVLPLLITTSGILLGLSCDILALLAVTLAATAVVCVAGFWSGEGVNVGSLIVSWVGLQGGYMIGLTARDMVSQLAARFIGVQSKRT